VLPGAGRSDFFYTIIAPQSARASECRNAAFGTDSRTGQDEHTILLRNLNHQLQCSAPAKPNEERLRRRASILACLALLLTPAGCGEPAPKTDAELALNNQQSSGRRVFERDCAACHSAYSSSGSKGPSLKNIFRKKFLPSGLPATDRFVEQTIVGGRNMMPPMGEAITTEELDDLMAYLHTL
jgi:mono/diheme cytochrome c family protein